MTSPPEKSSSKPLLSWSETILPLLIIIFGGLTAATIVAAGVLFSVAWRALPFVIGAAIIVWLACGFGIDSGVCELL